LIVTTEVTEPTGSQTEERGNGDERGAADSARFAGHRAYERTKHKPLSSRVRFVFGPLVCPGRRRRQSAAARSPASSIRPFVPVPPFPRLWKPLPPRSPSPRR